MPRKKKNFPEATFPNPFDEVRFPLPKLEDLEELPEPSRSEPHKEVKELPKMEIDPELSNILNDDDKLLFSLNVLGSLQKDEKLVEKGDLLSIDERWLFQGLRRWWSGDNKHKSSSKTLMIVTATFNRVKKLLDEEYADKKCARYDDIKYKQKCEERKRLINKYFVAISKAKTGLENSRDTYDDKYIKNAFNLSIEKVEDTLNIMQASDNSV
jgi:hypothetical protein